MSFFKLLQFQFFFYFLECVLSVVTYLCPLFITIVFVQLSLIHCVLTMMCGCGQCISPMYVECTFCCVAIWWCCSFV